MEILRLIPLTIIPLTNLRSPNSVSVMNAETKMPGAARPIERAPAGCCEYLIREDGVQKECGQPGAYQGRGRPFLTYCQMHGEYVGTRAFEVIALKADASGVRKVLKPVKLQQR